MFALRYGRNITKSCHVAPLQRYICRILRFCWYVGSHATSLDSIWPKNILTACWLRTACGLWVFGLSISSLPHSCRIFEPIL